MSAHSFVVGMLRWQELKTAGHIESREEKSQEFQSLTHVLLFIYSLGFQPREQCCPERAGRLTSFQLIKMTPHQHTQMFIFQVILNVKSTAPGITTVEMLSCLLPPRTVPLPLGTLSCCLAAFAATQLLWAHGSKDTVHHAGQALPQVFLHMREGKEAERRQEAKPGSTFQDIQCSTSSRDKPCLLKLQQPTKTVLLSRDQAVKYPSLWETSRAEIIPAHSLRLEIHGQLIKQNHLVQHRKSPQSYSSSTVQKFCSEIQGSLLTVSYHKIKNQVTNL